MGEFPLHEDISCCRKELVVVLSAETMAISGFQKPNCVPYDTRRASHPLSLNANNFRFAKNIHLKLPGAEPTDSIKSRLPREPGRPHPISVWPTLRQVSRDKPGQEEQIDWGKFVK